MWYVYFLRLSNGDIYVGSTNDLLRRFDSHGRGDVVSTKGFLSVTLKSYVAVESETVARKLERYFKSGSGKAFANKRLWQLGSGCAAARPARGRRDGHRMLD